MPKLFQAGRFGSGDIRARRFVIEGSHLVADAGWSPRLERSSTAVLDKISGAMLIGGRQRQARSQLADNSISPSRRSEFRPSLQ